MDPLAPLIDALHAEGRLRVWSLVVTVMGDAVQPRGGRIAAARLQDLLGRIGVEPGALRTALSRLVADGWLIRERNGRTSHYRLSGQGQAEYGPAAAAIYAAPGAEPECWTIALGDDVGGISLGGGLWLVAGNVPAEAALAVSGALTVSAEMRETLCPPDRLATLERLATDLDALEGARLDPQDAMAARIILIHRWRRIVLRHGDLPDAVLPARLSGLRSRVGTVYHALLPTSERWLETGDAPLPAADTGLAHRFAGKPVA
ncbi:PaaX family transcriptional regulator C-terminal domain-containing protein [Defluviimonas aestuarii]|uniref:PaaX family transcriptional regulator C-terminal domain-containing protein n=1 Tax=Albidovulum aestuarii TaxID=1130726 RepID=UPI00249A001D|nr:PaaX family transcriptional regulator C-terminal domain-containing protein [Defluviimonas aestuarii]MDI3337578.1 PaaX family transcriptional regulator C-terminal domain-containing protein [Defluviimonas aestuarii]